MITKPIAIYKLSAIKGGGYGCGEKTYCSVKRKIVQLGGSLSKQWNVCGSAGCKCKNPNHPVKHGHYYQLSYTLKGKSSTALVKKAVLKEVHARIKRHKEFRELCNALVEAYVTEFRKHGIEEE